MERGKPSDLSGGLGFTMSEEGGLDDVAEFFFAAALLGADTLQFRFECGHFGRKGLALGALAGC